ncbi:hypothetical protein PGH07_11195 [Sulfurovum sp. zt1-1]|uniref:Double Cache domain-containing protein n=1 Tax=Sulfurovum zhangzhouensis TaxID=3019067 RepID=A0ABT7R1R2_9BACT|nr:hypothetical protein [Sulfurovum zhangzhouensis]MDM5272739.1 hypothetical protein [Sulfurovum zhangzhouensis]
MKKYDKTVLIVMFFLLLILLSSSLFFFNRSEDDRIAELSDNIINEFRSALSNEMAELLSFSLALAENGDLKEALKKDDETEGYQILRDITERFKKHTHMKSLRVQVLTPEFYIFARSWSEGFEGMPIWWFREDLETLKNNKQPKVGMETGRLLTFKSTIPIRSQKTLLGYLEVIRFVDEFSVKLHTKGIELFALMDEVYLEQASLMRNFPRLFGRVIANQNYNSSLRRHLENIDTHKLFEKQFLMDNDRLLLWEPMYNGEGDEIGGYLLVLSDESLKNYETDSHDFLFFRQFSQEDINRAFELKGQNFGSFKSGYDRDLVGLLPKLHEEDKRELEQEAREILNLYDKNELIDIILENKYKEKKTGVIE